MEEVGLDKDKLLEGFKHQYCSINTFIPRRLLVYIDDLEIEIELTIGLWTIKHNKEVVAWGGADTEQAVIDGIQEQMIELVDTL
jgi:hypothetical protein